MEFLTIEKEYISRQMETAAWERECDNRQTEIQQKQKELHLRKLKLQAWEKEFQNKQINFIMTNGIVVKTLYNI